VSGSDVGSDLTGYSQNHVDQALSGKYVVHGNSADADCVIACSFGYREREGGTEPGLSNEELAAFITRRFSSLPKILQTEIADALPSANRDQHVYVIAEAQNSGQRLDTPEIISQAKNVMQTHSWQTAIVCAHPHHLPWVDYLCQAAGITTVAPEGLQTIPFDPRSAQYWTRSLAAWQKEVHARHSVGDPRTPQED
jgi:hypothetical protein